MATKRENLIALLQDPAKQKEYRQRGKASVPGGHNACAATASQPYVFDLRLLDHVETFAETIATKLKRTRLFSASSDRNDVKPGDLIVCQDLNEKLGSDHVWHVVRDLGSGWFECLDNQGSKLTYRRRLDGADGKTPMRGRLRLKN